MDFTYHLDKYQKDIFDEMRTKMNGGLVLPVGSGKTLISLTYMLTRYYETGIPGLFICSKTLLTNVQEELRKWFPQVIFQVVHNDYIKPNKWVAQGTFPIVISTTEVCSKMYKTHNVENFYITTDGINDVGSVSNVKTFNLPTIPLISTPNVFHSYSWSSLFVDEAQDYLNYETVRNKSLSSICSLHRWAMSGTIINEPAEKNVFGLYLMMHIKNVPRTFPSFQRWLKSIDVISLRDECVLRDLNPNFKLPDINFQPIEHSLTEGEKNVYLLFKELLEFMHEKMEDKKTIVLYTLITGIRQTVLCPLIPLSSVVIKNLTRVVQDEKTDIDIIKEEIQRRMMDSNVFDYVNDVESVKSSRMKKIIEIIDENIDSQVIVYSTFSIFLDVFKHFISKKNRDIWMLKSKMSIHERENIINQFRNSRNGVLLLTYKLGAAGLNLQTASTVILADFWWNDGTTQQAIGRIRRQGQKASIVNIYYLTSNTGMEKAIFDKHIAKKSSINALFNGSLQTKIKSISIGEIVDMINEYENKDLIKVLTEKTLKLHISDISRFDSLDIDALIELCDKYISELNRGVGEEGN